MVDTNPSVVDTQVDTYYPLQFATSAGQPDALRYLLEHGDDANRAIRDGECVSYGLGWLASDLAVTISIWCSYNIILQDYSIW
jgi:hypothetical protein